MRASSILAKLITLASIVGIVAAQGTTPTSPVSITTTTSSGASPTTTCTGRQCSGTTLGQTTTSVPRTSSCPSPPCRPVPTTTSALVGVNNTMTIPTGPKNATSPTSGGSNMTISGTAKSGGTPTGGTGSGSGSGSGSGGGSGGSSSGGSVAPAATSTKSPGSTGAAARNGGSVVAVVLLGSLVWLLG